MSVARSGMVTLALLALVAGVAEAQSESAKGKGKRFDSAAAPSVAKRTSGKDAEAKSSDVEVRLIREYFASREVKPKPLPPGIAKNLARGKPIPPGIARTRTPDDLLRRLPARDGARWVLAGDVVLLVDVGDIVRDIVRALP